jgi:hypothetical protein
LAHSKTGNKDIFYCFWFLDVPYSDSHTIILSVLRVGLIIVVALLNSGNHQILSFSDQELNLTYMLNVAGSSEQKRYHIFTTTSLIFLKLFVSDKVIQIESESNIRINPVVESSILAITGHAIAIR